jgi:diaminopimelate epimerase
VRFFKYQALGNDYLVVEPSASVPSPAVIRRICDRHYGVGSDGILTWTRKPGADITLRIFNPDGSEAEKSGNGLRIFARYLWDIGQVGADAFDVVTRGGTARCHVHDGGRQITVDMGRASFSSADIPVRGPLRDVIDEAIEVGGERVRFTAVTVGNPHCVVYTEKVTPDLAKRLGGLLENHELFPNRTNVQFVEVVDRSNITIEIWERGAGYTLASGSSSCACAAASVRLGRCDPDVTVTMPGGKLAIVVSPDFSLRMTGPAAKVADGTIAPELLGDAG